jgi:hypothetical protein
VIEALPVKETSIPEARVGLVLPAPAVTLGTGGSLLQAITHSNSAAINNAAMDLFI